MKAGRKPIPAHTRKIQRTVTIQPETLAWLEASRADGESIGHVLDRIASTNTTTEQPPGKVLSPID